MLKIQKIFDQFLTALLFVQYQPIKIIVTESEQSWTTQLVFLTTVCEVAFYSDIEPLM